MHRIYLMMLLLSGAIALHASGFNHSDRNLLYPALALAGSTFSGQTSTETTKDSNVADSPSFPASENGINATSPHSGISPSSALTPASGISPSSGVQPASGLPSDKGSSGTPAR